MHLVGEGSRSHVKMESNGIGCIACVVFAYDVLNFTLIPLRFELGSLPSSTRQTIGADRFLAVKTDVSFLVVVIVHMASP